MEAAEFVTSYLAAWNNRDSKAVANHLAENGVYLDIPVHHNMSREELIAHLDELFEEEINIYELTGEVLAGKNTVAFQYKVIPPPPADGGAPPEPWYGAEFITLQDNVALEIADYYEAADAQSPGSPLANATRPATVQRYAKSGLSAEQMESVKSQISSLMTDEKIYLTPDLTLPALAQALDCTVNHVSQAINAGFGKSFFDYLNDFRVHDAMALLGDNSHDRTVLSVALEVGFNSTSTFYVAFKKVTGQTPAQYRKAQANLA